MTKRMLCSLSIQVGCWAPTAKWCLSLCILATSTSDSRRGSTFDKHRQTVFKLLPAYQPIYIVVCSADCCWRKSWYKHCC